MTQSVLIHCKPSLEQFLTTTDLMWSYNDTQDFDEIDVIVDDVPYIHSDGIYQDPDEQLCEHYGIDYDEVNCIEAA